MLERKARYCSPEAIRDNFLWGSRSIVLAGTHGKTTTTSLTAWLLTSGGLDPSLLVGASRSTSANTGPAIARRPRFRDRGDEYDSAFFDKTAKFLTYRRMSRSSATSSSITRTSTPTSMRSFSRSGAWRTWSRRTGCCAGSRQSACAGTGPRGRQSCRNVRPWAAACGGH